MMKIIIFLAVVAFAAAEPEYYNLVRIDMDGLVKDPKALKEFVDCLLDRKQCSPLYSTYKALTSEAVEQKCAKCSPDQKHSFWLFLLGVRAWYPEDYFNFKRKYDPTNKYFDELEAELRQYGY